MCDTDLIDAYDLAENGRGGGDPGPPVTCFLALFCCLGLGLRPGSVLPHLFVFQFSRAEGSADAVEPAY